MGNKAVSLTKRPSSNDAAAARAWPISDHFDGRRFLNPTLPGRSAPALRSVFKMLREPRSRWPRSVENKGVPKLNVTLATDDIAVTFVNHATFLIQIGGIAILTDPVWSERASMLRWAGPRRVRKPGVAFDDLPKIDLVLLSHNHYDHLDLATLRRLRQTFLPTVLVAAGDARLVGPVGFKDMRELDWWDETPIGEALKVTFVPAQHTSARGLHDRQRSLWGGYMIESRGRLIYFSGDSGYQNISRTSNRGWGLPRSRCWASAPMSLDGSWSHST
jgi:hypothetical protein